MKSLRELYRIGTGPSSSHTMGPRAAARMFLDRHPEARRIRLTLFGSLAATGKGHLTEQAVRELLQSIDVEVIWKPDQCLPLHPNGMRFELLEPSSGAVAACWEVYSTGGGALMEAGQPAGQASVYKHDSMTGILGYCEQTGLSFWEYVLECEGEGLTEYLFEAWKAMKAAVERGIRKEGVLPGGLALPRKSASFYRRAGAAGDIVKQQAYLASYVLAVSEENASGGIIVTAPTCGASGVLPGLLYCLGKFMDITEEQIVRALATAGLIGNLAKSNASISGAEVGCQGEVGVACAMAAAAAAQLMGGSVRQIEYAAEMGIEHHLGLTCDPVAGLVQIPCIERNVFAASRALTCAEYALSSDGVHRIPYDEVLAVMLETGRNLSSLYRETASGGLAAAYRRRCGSSYGLERGEEDAS